MRYKKIFAAVMSLCILFSVSGCGDNTDIFEQSEASVSDTEKAASSVSETTKKAETSVSDNTKETEKASSEKSSQSSAVPKETEPPTEKETVSADPYEYYNILDSELNNENAAVSNTFGAWHGKGYYINREANINGDVYVFDRNGKGKQIYSGDSHLEHCVFCNGNFYIITNDYNTVTVSKTDMDGNELLTYSVDIEGDRNAYWFRIDAVSAYGDVMLHSGAGYDTKLYMLNSDFSAINYPEFYVDKSGKTITEYNDIYNYNSGYTYGNKLYFPENSVYFDCVTGEWHECSLQKAVGSVGKYVFTGSSVYDMEKDEFANGFPKDAYKDYCGGQHHITWDGSEWKEYKAPADAETVYNSACETAVLGTDYMEYRLCTIQLDDEKYAVVYPYGIYICSYEKGSSEEKVAVPLGLTADILNNTGT
ncbi:MAG: hypothetical protein IJ666_01850 [Ruminococcus sp.]|nr:hypothetical protein [Ruminococcus sp.]